MTSSSAKLTAYKVNPSDLLDLIDAAALANQYTAVTRCGGGRIINNGYICPHCGEDPSMRYGADGKEVYQRKPGEKVFRKCGASAKKVLAETDLTTMLPTFYE